MAMLPLINNTLVRNRSNTVPSNSNRSNHQTTTLSGDVSSANNQYGVQLSSKDSSDCKKLKSGKVCMTTNRPFKRSITLGSLFSSKSSRSASTNSLNSSVVEDTIAAVLRSQTRNEFLSELDLNQTQTGNYFDNSNSSSSLCKANSTTSTSTDENAILENLVHDSFSSDSNQSVNELSRQQSTSELNNQSNFDSNHQTSTPSYPPPRYTPKRRPVLLRSQSAPHHTGDLLSNASILENIQEISRSNVTQPNQTLTSVAELEIVQEDEELEMASRRNSYLNHRFHCRLAHEKEIIPIAGFNSKEELYERISNAFKIDIDQVSF